MATTDRRLSPAVLADALDRPVWHALGGPQRHLDVGPAGVRRIDPAYGPFAAAAPGREAALGEVIGHGEVWLVEPEAVTAPDGLRALRVAPLLQMIAEGTVMPFEDAGIVTLSERDVPEMTELALATAPGPWAAETWRYGQFFGIRIDGRLAAMAGARMRPACGLAEVSGVCAWPEYRRQGLAARLIRKVMAGMAGQGDMPYLHSYAGNGAAIRLYESLGFRARRTMVATVLGKAE